MDSTNSFMKNRWPEAKSMLQTVKPFHPLSYRIEGLIDTWIQAHLNVTFDFSDTELIEEFKKLAKSLALSWLQDDSFIDNPNKWNNILLKNSREINQIIDKFIHHAAELLYAIWIIVHDLVTCAGYEATNYRPPKLTSDQNFITWFEACKKEREGAVANVLYGI